MVITRKQGDQAKQKSADNSDPALEIKANEHRSEKERLPLDGTPVLTRETLGSWRGWAGTLWATGTHQMWCLDGPKKGLFRKSSGKQPPAGMVEETETTGPAARKLQPCQMPTKGIQKPGNRILASTEPGVSNKSTNSSASFTSIFELFFAISNQQSAAWPVLYGQVPDRQRRTPLGHLQERSLKHHPSGLMPAQNEMVGARSHATSPWLDQQSRAPISPAWSILRQLLNKEDPAQRSKLDHDWHPQEPALGLQAKHHQTDTTSATLRRPQQPSGQRSRSARSSSRT